MSRLTQAIYQEAQKVTTSFISWGLGVLFMAAYCLFIYWLNKQYGQYLMIIGAMLYLTVFFFFIDLWWRYKKEHLIKD